MIQQMSVPAGQAELELAMLVAMTRSAKPENADALKSQIPFARVLTREFTGPGFYTEYEIEGEPVLFPRAKFEGRADFAFEDWGLRAAARFDDGRVALFSIAVTQGLLRHLEGSMLEMDRWPEDVSSFGIESTQ